jgi:hypothetical protein
MPAEQVWRMRCDGPCKGWLSVPESAFIRTWGGEAPEVPGDALECHETALRAGMWPTRSAAEAAARGAGWEVQPNCRLDAKPHVDCEFNAYCREGRECKTDGVQSVNTLTKDGRTSKRLIDYIRKYGWRNDH